MLSPEYFEKIFIRLCVIGKFYVYLQKFIITRKHDFSEKHHQVVWFDTGA